MNRDKCKYYNKHLETIREYIGCLYELEGCGSGGMLHILLDDDNIDDDDIAFCLGKCLQHPEREEAEIGKLICLEYLKVPMPTRRLLTRPYIYYMPDCMKHGQCEKCYVETGLEEHML